MRRVLLPVLLSALALAGCDLTMTRQPKYGPDAVAPLFDDRAADRAPPEGTVPLGQPTEAEAAAAPPPVDAALLARGRERHEIFCKPCHGVGGAGDGTVVLRGFPRPPPYWDPRVRQASADQLYGAITKGYGVMFPYAERVPPHDRWAMVAYIRALNLAHDRGAASPPPPSGSEGGRR